MTQSGQLRFNIVGPRHLREQKMNWDAIGAIGEILGALAVFVSLLYLAIQIRYSNAQAQSEAVGLTTKDWVNQYKAAFGSEERVVLMRKGLNDYSNLSQDEKGTFFSIVIGFIASFDNIYNKYQHGQLRKEVCDSMEEAFASIAVCPGIKQFWTMAGGQLSLPPYLQVYTEGRAPEHREIKPFNEIYDFLQLSDRAS